MSLTFADTHNMVSYLNKSDASEGFNQFIDFLNGSHIKYALTVNPTIYVSCIKQFWSTVVIKQSNDVTRLQALVDKKKVMITEAAIRDVLRLDDAKGVNCLPNEEIFAELARMVYVKPSTKLTFYKAFFSSQWKFLIHTILQSMSAKRTSWNEFSSAIASANICLSTGDLLTHSTRYTSPALTQKVFANMRRVRKRCSGVETPLFEGMLVAGEPKEQGDAEEQVQGNVDDAAQGATTAVSGDDEALDACDALTRRVEHLEHDKVAQDLEITKLKTRVKKLERANKVKTLKLKRLRKVGTSQRIESSDDIDMEDASNQGRMIAKLDRDTCVALMVDGGIEKKVEDVQVASDEDVKGRQAEIYQIDMDHATKVLSMQEDKPKVESVSATSTTIVVVPAATITAAPVRVASKDKGKGIMVEEPKLMKKKQQVKIDEAYARKLHEELNQDIDWDVAIDHVKQKAKEDPLDYFKGMSYDDIQEEENRARESINEPPAQKAAKRMKLNEEVEDLNQHLEIMPDEDDDVYTEATPLARKVPVMDYQIIQLNNKPHYKIIRADETHQLAMFKRPDGQNQVWKSQRSVHGQAKVKNWKLLESCSVHIISFTTTQLILLVEKRYLLSRFTLDQMLNEVTLQVEEQSEMSLELLRFIRQQLQEGQHE
uniref:Xylulose kinase-1 n=1 Tax=Tanacetum cinerariifolium TaxID=118510 RepID=A0A6L2KL48_TANCI|nr:xylulose kinase-1 [Tanacetum cinerariifolium]